jgi:hypothetical protein
MQILTSFDQSTSMKLAWLVHSRPDVAYGAAIAAPGHSGTVRQVNMPYQMFKCHYQAFKYIARRVHEISNAHCCFTTYLRLLRCLVRQQRGYFLANGLHSSAEAIAFAEGFDQGFANKNDLQEILGKVIPLTILTDSKTLFDVITKASYTHKKRILIDLACARATGIEF